MSSINFEEINSTMPNGWHKTVMWERVLWTDSEGNLMKDNFNKLNNDLTLLK